MTAKDIAGQRFGRLVAMKPAGHDKGKRLTWECRCDCGKMTVVPGHTLRDGRTVSCGCYRDEKIGDRARTHGMRSVPLYRTWKGISQRCYNPALKHYARWGGRGIGMHKPWRDSFIAFFDYVSQLPHYGEIGYSIDRIDNDGNYEPGNIRWATRIEQNRNTRKNHLITFDGETKCVTEWSESTGISAIVIFSRLYAGWTVERALTQAVQVQDHSRKAAQA